MQTRSGGQWCLPGDGPDEGGQFASDGDGDLVLVFALVDQGAITLAEPDLCLPADVLDGRAEFFESDLQLSADLGRIAIGPGAFDEVSAGMTVAGLGDATLAALCATGVFGRCEAEVGHELPRVVEAGQVTEFGDDGDGGEELYTAQGLNAFDDGIETPLLRLFLEFGIEALEAVLLFGDSTDVFLEDDLLSGGIADDFAEPAQVGRVPVGFALVADILAQQEGLEAELGGFEVLEGVFPGAGEVTDGLIGKVGDIDGREVAGAHQAGECCGIAAVGFDAVAGLFGDERG